MLLMQYLAEIEATRLMVQEPELNFDATRVATHRQWQVQTVPCQASLQGDLLICGTLRFPEFTFSPMGLAWGFDSPDTGTMNRFLFSPDSGVWQVTHVMLGKQLTRFSHRGRMNGFKGNALQMAVLVIQGMAFFYLGNLQQPVFQCAAADLPVIGNGLGLCAAKGDCPAASDLRVWQLTTRACQHLDIEAMVNSQGLGSAMIV